MAMKGPQAGDEMKEAAHAINLLGGKVENVLEYTLSDESCRSLIITKKVSKTPAKYPRHNSKIKSKPL